MSIPVFKHPILLRTQPYTDKGVNRKRWMIYFVRSEGESSEEVSDKIFHVVKHLTEIGKAGLLLSVYKSEKAVDDAMQKISGIIDSENLDI